MNCLPRLAFVFGLGATLLGANAAGAAAVRESSRIQVSLDPTNGPAVPSGPAGSMMSSMSDDGTTASAKMQVRVRHLAPDTEHIVMGDGIELIRFMTNASGTGRIALDLLATGTATTPSFDPRGKQLTVSDGVDDVLAAWVYADPANDPSRTKITESTTLPAVQLPTIPAAVTPGTVTARYDKLPKQNRSRFTVSLRGVPAGDYDIAVDGIVVGSLTTNPAGVARLGFDTKTNGNGKGGGKGNNGGPAHNQRKLLDFDPRNKQIDVIQAGVVLFSGPMLAQIDHLGLCTPSETNVALTRAPGQSTGSGSVITGVEESCDLTFDVDVADLPAGSYDLVVDTAVVAPIAVADDGSGHDVGSIAFDEIPDSGENVLAFPFGPGSVVEVKQGATTFLSATLP